jgi:regulator of RNase E activity RraA
MIRVLSGGRRDGKENRRRDKSRQEDQVDDREIFAALRDRLYTAVVGDVMDTLGFTAQFLPADIRPLREDMVVVGRAMTVQEADLAPGEAETAEAFGLMLKALDDLKDGEVYICAGAAPVYALWGGLMTTRAMKLGAAGAVLGGCHRDTREILALGFPVFSAGAYAQDQKNRGVVTDFRTPIEFASGVRVISGDIVFGDVDGVAIIPRDAATEVIRLALEKVDGENIVRRMIEAGETSAAAFAKTGIM